MPLLDPLTSVKVSLKEARIIPDVISDGEVDTFQPSMLFSISWGEKQAMLGNELQVSDTSEEPHVSLAPMGTEDGEAAYALAMLDPDAPSRSNPKNGPFRHWLISGLKPRTEAEVCAATSAERELLSTPLDPLAALSTRSAITAYRPPNPGPGTGTHRYGTRPDSIRKYVTLLILASTSPLYFRTDSIATRDFAKHAAMHTVFLLFREPQGGLKMSLDAPEFGTETEARRNWSAMKFAQQHGLELVGANYFKVEA